MATIKPARICTAGTMKVGSEGSWKERARAAVEMSGIHQHSSFKGLILLTNFQWEVGLP